MVRFLGTFLVLRFLFKASSLCEVFGRQILDMHLPDMHLSFANPQKQERESFLSEARCCLASCLAVVFPDDS